MTSASALNSLLAIGTLCLVVALIAYRLLWAGSGFAGYFAGARWMPKPLQRLRRWLQGGKG